MDESYVGKLVTASSEPETVGLVIEVNVVENWSADSGVSKVPSLGVITYKGFQWWPVKNCEVIKDK